MTKKRFRQLNPISDSESQGQVLYWMSRDQRVDDNWALLAAQEYAIEKKQGLAVIFCLAKKFIGAGNRQYDFMLNGLKEVEQALKPLNIPFHLICGDPGGSVAEFALRSCASAVFTEFAPLKIKQSWKKAAVKKIKVPCFEVDAHNIVPCVEASDKQEFAARTFRPRIQKKLPDFLVPIPRLKKHPYTIGEKPDQFKQSDLIPCLKCARGVPVVPWIEPGETAARKALKSFIRKKLEHYHTVRNNPCVDGQSGLSPYLHFGQLSAQRVALDVQKSSAPEPAKAAFLEELIVRRELADNFCWYNPEYDSVKGFPDWAKKSIGEHADDPREYIYTRRQFENAETHDNLWNAAQMEMVVRGKMHGFMRMYWGKKILEWTESAEQAMEIAIYLNDKYELDSRDPNGYAGIAWCMGGVHDRAWNQHPVFGKIRYMNYNGCKRKFNVDEYIRKVNLY